MTHPFDEIALAAHARALREHPVEFKTAEQFSLEKSHAALSAAFQSARERGMVEICEDFMFSDDGPHNFGCSEDDLPTVTIIRHKENEHDK